MNVNEKIADLKDGKPWSDMDLWDLEISLARGHSIEQVADFLCRHGTIDEVRQKADELGFKYRSEALRQ